MSMTVTESTAVNVILTRLYGPAPHSTRHEPTQAEVDAAARDLAAGAHRRLMAGWSPERLAERQEQLKHGPRA